MLKKEGLIPEVSELKDGSTSRKLISIVSVLVSSFWSDSSETKELEKDVESEVIL